MPKRGRLNQDEIDFIIENAEKLTPEEIGTKLDRRPETVSDLIASRGLPGYSNTTSAERAESLAIRAELRGSEKWRRLWQELTKEEIRFFEQEYIRLMAQFRNDVLASEETQIFDCIKFEILKSRNLIERRKAREDISRLELMQGRLLSQHDSPAEMEEKDRELVISLEAQLKESRATEQSRTNEFVKLQERHDALMKSLKSTRDQRIREIESGKETILGLLKALQRKETQDAEGRQMRLMELAAKKEHDRLGRLHEYEDGSVDRPILSPETVDLGDEGEA